MTPKKVSTKRQRQRRSSRGDYALYESLKASLIAYTVTPADYEAACRRAAKIAGV